MPRFFQSRSARRSAPHLAWNQPQRQRSRIDLPFHAPQVKHRVKEYRADALLLCALRYRKRATRSTGSG